MLTVQTPFSLFPVFCYWFRNWLQFQIIFYEFHEAFFPHSRLEGKESGSRFVSLATVWLEQMPDASFFLYDVTCDHPDSQEVKGCRSDVCLLPLLLMFTFLLIPEVQDLCIRLLFFMTFRWGNSLFVITQHVRHILHLIPNRALHVLTTLHSGYGILLPFFCTREKLSENTVEAFGELSLDKI